MENPLHSGHAVRAGRFFFPVSWAIRRIWSASFSMASFFPVPWASLWKFFYAPGRERFPPPVFRCSFLSSLVFLALPAEGMRGGDFLSLEPPAQRHVPQQAFLLGEPFPGRHLFRAFLSTWACSCCEGERTGRRPSVGTFLPPAIFFQGTFPSVLSWGLSCGGKLSAGRYGLPYSLPGRSFPGSRMRLPE